MAEGENLEHRVSRLENQVPRLQAGVERAGSDAVDARLLAAGADRDVAEVRSELQAHRRLLEALHENQREFAEQLTEQGRRTAAGFATVHAGMRTITTLLERALDTDPDGPASP